MINVFIVDDHNVVIEGILSLLQNSPDILVCGYAQKAAECLNFLGSNAADVILMDINLPDMSGLDLCKTVNQTHSEIKIIALSTFNQISYINKMTANGASGYLLKNITKEELVQAIKTVANGNTYHSFEVHEIIKTAKTKSENTPILTKWENDILKLVAEGYTN
jgi:DNA-binding NarL/FixJ family response regulator